MTWRFALISVVMMTLGVGVPSALAHTELVQAIPAPGSSVGPALAEIRLTFSEALSPGSTLEILGAGFQSVPGLTSQISGLDLLAALPAPLGPGTYTVQWAAVTADGHSQSGSYQFAIRAETSANSGLAIVALVVASLGVVVYFARRIRFIRSIR